MTDKKIQNMIDKLEKEKEKIAGLRGSKSQLLKQLEDEGCKDIKDAEKQAEKERKNAQKYRDKRDELIVELEEEYEWE